jgi:hypothetical protein
VSGDYWDDPEMQQWARRVSDEVVPMIRDSAATISIVPSGESDMKFAVELGLSIMMDKPIIIAVPAGVQVPSKLVLLADEIVELPSEGFGDETRERLNEAINRVLGES